MFPFSVLLVANDIYWGFNSKYVGPNGKDGIRAVFHKTEKYNFGTKVFSCLETTQEHISAMKGHNILLACIIFIYLFVLPFCNDFFLLFTTCLINTSLIQWNYFY